VQQSETCAPSWEWKISSAHSCLPFHKCQHPP